MQCAGCEEFSATSARRRAAPKATGRPNATISRNASTMKATWTTTPTRTKNDRGCVVNGSRQARLKSGCALPARLVAHRSTSSMARAIPNVPRRSFGSHACQGDPRADIVETIPRVHSVDNPIDRRDRRYPQSSHSRWPRQVGLRCSRPASLCQPREVAVFRTHKTKSLIALRRDVRPQKQKPGNPFRLPGFRVELGCGDRI